MVIDRSLTLDLISSFQDIKIQKNFEIELEPEE